MEYSPKSSIVFAPIYLLVGNVFWFEIPQTWNHLSHCYIFFFFGLPLIYADTILPNGFKSPPMLASHDAWTAVIVRNSPTLCWLGIPDSAGIITAGIAIVKPEPTYSKVATVVAINYGFFFSVLIRIRVFVFSNISEFLTCANMLRSLLTSFFFWFDSSEFISLKAFGINEIFWNADSFFFLSESCFILHRSVVFSREH